MSERTVSENNKLWENAEKIAQQVVAEKKAESEEERRKQKKRVIKLLLLMVLIALIIVFASIAWFALNKSVSSNTMAIEAKGDAYSIQPLGDKGGLYDTYIDDLGVEAIKWTLSSTNNMENRYKENGDPTSSQMAEITRLDSEDYGLKPGDHGTTFGGNPLATAAGLSVFKIFENENLVKNANEMGVFFKEKLNAVMQKYPDKITDIRCAGLLIGIELKEKIAKTDELLSEITGYKHFLFRAPNVAYSQAMYAVIEKPFIDVSIWSQDYQNSTAKDDLVNNVINNLKDGGIINMHSVHEKTAQAVPEILEQCKDKGYQVVGVSELFAIKGKKLMTGVKYNNAE